jgi:hypothetical protein
VPVVVALTGVGGGAAVAGSGPQLRADGPTSVSGTAGTAVFEIGVHRVRQVRYRDRGTLQYSFVLRNGGPLPVTVTGLAEKQPPSRLFRARRLVGGEGQETVRIPAGGSADVRLALFMSGCETLSARAGSLVTDVVLRTERAAFFDDEVRVQLPEELRTGSPREAFCPEATATSRPPG